VLISLLIAELRDEELLPRLERPASSASAEPHFFSENAYSSTWYRRYNIILFHVDLCGLLTDREYLIVAYEERDVLISLLIAELRDEELLPHNLLWLPSWSTDCISLGASPCKHDRCST
jgi:hypothetical protein